MPNDENITALTALIDEWWASAREDLPRWLASRGVLVRRSSMARSSRMPVDETTEALEADLLSVDGTGCGRS